MFVHDISALLVVFHILTDVTLQKYIGPWKYRVDKLREFIPRLLVF